MRFESTSVIEKEEYEYEYFYNKKQRDSIFFFTKNAVEYIEKIGECNLVFMDRSARPGYTAIDEYWNIKHHDDGLPKPKFYFVNPKGFNTNRNWMGERDSGDVLEEIEDNFTELTQDTEKPLILVDTCIHYGTTLENVTYHFKELGFKNIKFLIANTRQNHSDIKSEIPSVSLDECDVFGDTSDYGDVVSNENIESVISKKTKKGNGVGNKIMMNEAKVVRREMRQIVKEGLEV